MTTPESDRQATPQPEQINWWMTPTQRRHIKRLERNADAAMENLYRLLPELPRS